MSSLICYLSKYSLQPCANVELSEQQYLPPFWQTDASCWTELQNRHSQSSDSGDFCFGELTSDSLSSTLPLKTNNWGCSKAVHYLIWDSQYRCVPSFHLSCSVTFFTQVLGTTWASIFTSSGFTHKATPISHPVSLVPLIWTQTGLDLFHIWSKNTYYGSATRITNPDWEGLLKNLHVLKKFHHLDSMETQMRNTSLQGRSSSNWSTIAICCQRTSFQFPEFCLYKWQ